MNVYDYLSQVAYVDKSNIEGDDSDCYYSIFDGSYITHVGLADDELIKFLAEHEITGELTHGVGFSHKEQKWYGWSHRAIYGFGVGSEVKRGDCGYNPVDKYDFLDCCIEFWRDEDRNSVSAIHADDGVHVNWECSDSVPNEKLRNKISGVVMPYPEKYGRGEWQAETLADAKLMAQDFSSGVS